MARLRVPLDISLFGDKTKSLEITIKQDITPEKIIHGILKKCSVSDDPNQFELCIVSGTKCTNHKTFYTMINQYVLLS